MSFGLSEDILNKIVCCLQGYPQLHWVKIYGSRAMGNYAKGSDIDIAFSSKTDIASKLLSALDELSTPYLFDVTHYETIDNPDLKDHIDRVGKQIFP